MKTLCSFLLASLLSGCMSFPAQCERDGYQPGTQEFQYCVSDKQTRAMTAALIMAGGLNSAASSFNSAASAQQPSYPPVVNCTTYLNTMKCTGY